jgi:hypothetical protein
MDRLFEIVRDTFSVFPVLYILCGTVGMWGFLRIVTLIDPGLIRSSRAGPHHKKPEAREV